jgi:hypothetical protein
MSPLASQLFSVVLRWAADGGGGVGGQGEVGARTADKRTRVGGTRKTRRRVLQEWVRCKSWRNRELKLLLLLWRRRRRQQAALEEANLAVRVEIDGGRMTTLAAAASYTIRTYTAIELS